MKNITMTMYDPNTEERIELSRNYSETATWSMIACTFFQFLAAQGYLLTPEKVGADYDHDEDDEVGEE